MYINDLHQTIEYSEVHHFADDTNLLNFHNSVKSIKKEVNHNLKNLANWLKANKISVTKTYSRNTNIANAVYVWNH